MNKTVAAILEPDDRLHRLYATEADHRLAKSAAAMRGISLQAWLSEAIREKFAREAE